LLGGLRAATSVIKPEEVSEAWFPICIIDQGRQVSESQENPRKRLVLRVLQQPLSTVADAVVPVIVDAVDLDETLEKVHVDDVIQRMDLDALLRRIDIEAIVDRVDIDRILARIDLDEVIGRIDLDALVQRMDIDALIDRVDIPALTNRVDIQSILKSTTRGVFATVLDAVRRQLAGIDLILARVVDKLLRRKSSTGVSDRPASLGRDTERGEEPDGISGRIAGVFSRSFAFVVDVVAIFAAFAAGSAVVLFIARLLSGHQTVQASTDGGWWTVVLCVWAFAYFLVSFLITGRTLGMLVAGLKVVSLQGTPLSGRQALLRVLVLAISIWLFWFALLAALLDRRHRSFHDFVAKTLVVYDWGDRPAQLPSPLTRWLTRQGVHFEA
jgi:uncharacterized RDD family membrane protein YckC